MAVLTTKGQPRVLVAVNSFIPHFHRKALGAALGAVVAGLALTGGQAKALTVSVGGFDYDVTTFTGSYNDNVSKFNTLNNGGSMPWFGNELLAGEFAFALGGQFGIPNGDNGSQSGSGPLFAWEVKADNRYESTGWPLGRSLDPTVRSMAITPENVCSPNCLSTYLDRTDYSAIYAQASLAASGSDTGGTASVPGPLPILGLAAAFGFSRKLRKRIKLHRSSTAVSTSPGA
jgi:hypothetical protein